MTSYRLSEPDLADVRRDALGRHVCSATVAIIEIDCEEDDEVVEVVVSRWVAGAAGPREAIALAEAEARMVAAAYVERESRGGLLS